MYFSPNIIRKNPSPNTKYIDTPYTYIETYKQTRKTKTFESKSGVIKIPFFSFVVTKFCQNVSLKRQFVFSFLRCSNLAFGLVNWRAILTVVPPGTKDVCLSRRTFRDRTYSQSVSYPTWLPIVMWDVLRTEPYRLSSVGRCRMRTKGSWWVVMKLARRLCTPRARIKWLYF